MSRILAQPISRRHRFFLLPGPRACDPVDRATWTLSLAIHEIELVDIADESRTSAQSGANVAIHLNAHRAPDGDRIAAVVWTQPAGGSRVTLEAVTERDHQGRRSSSSSSGLNPAVTGKIDPQSVRLRGLHVSFVENGHHRSLQLTA
jgi:hypothetical protein